MISRCVKVPFPKILIFYLIYFKYGNSPISFWPWATDLVIIFLSGLFCTHFLLYKVWIDGSLFLLHLWTSQNPYLILLPLHLSGETFTKLPTFFDTLTGLWKYHTTKLIQDNKVKPLIWNTGNFTSSLSTIPASLLHLHCSETSESSSRLFLVLHIWLHHLFNRENRNLRKDLLCLPAQSPNILWLLILPFIFDSCVIGRGSLLLSRKNIRALVLSPSKPNFVNYLISLSIFSVNSFSPCFFQWGPRWPQASSLKII